MKIAIAAAAIFFGALYTLAGAQATGTIWGQITSAGKPVPYAIVIADYQQANIGARADATGHYKIEGVPTGNHDVFSFADGGYIYDHGGFPKIGPGKNEHTRNLVHLKVTNLAPTVEAIKWSAVSGVPGAILDVSATWKAHDHVGISDELFAFVPEFQHPARFGVGKTQRGKNPDGNYTAHLTIPTDAKPGNYTAYIFGASEACYTTVHFPTQKITVK